MTESNAKKIFQKTPKKGLFVALAIAALVGVIFFVALQPTRLGLGAWQPASVPYAPDCGADCLEAGTLGSAHGSQGVVMRYDPTVDDEIAQWGDCLQSIFTCMDDQGTEATSESEKAQLINTCVAASACPSACTARFAKVTSTDANAVLAAFEAVFIGDQAWCLPVEDAP